MAVPQTRNQAEPKAQSNEPESIAQHLRRIAAAACWAVAPFVAGLLLFGYMKFALSMVGGALVSFTVFASLRVMVYKGLGMSAPQPGGIPEPPGPAAFAQFAVGSLVKLFLAIGVVFGLMKLGANPLALLSGFVVAQVAIGIVVSRGIKGPV